MKKNLPSGMWHIASFGFQLRSKIATSCLLLFLFGIQAWGLPTDRMYSAKTVTIYADQQDDVKITGAIVDEDTGVPILGANIVEKNNESNGVSTDFDGEFSITVPSNATLVISYVGYESQEVGVSKLSLDQISKLGVKLKPETSGLDEVVVVGYGQQSKVSMVGSVSSMKPEKLRTPSTNISSNLAGNIAGVIGVQRSGRPGADGANFFIRGLSSYQGVQNPLILMDGVEISMGDLDNLTPENIESVSVLKDATATAVYGNEGANGVLIITTKEGGDMEKPRIRARVQSQLSMPTKVQRFVRGPEYMELFNEAVTNRSTGELLYAQSDIDATRDQLHPYIYPDIDWYDLMFKEATVNEEANLNVRGGGEKLRYYMSGTFKHQTGLLKEWNLNSFDNGIDLKTYEFQNNINVDLSPTTSIALKLNTQLTSENGPVVGADNIYGTIMNSNPVDFVPYFPTPDSLGGGNKNILYGNKAGGGANGQFNNPVGEMNKGYSDNFRSVILATLTAEQKLDFITKGLSANGLVSFKNFSAKDIHRTRDYNGYQISSYVRNPNGVYDYEIEQIGDYLNQSLHLETSHYGDRNFKLQGSLNYSRKFDKHDVGGLFVYNQKEFNDHASGSIITSLPKRRIGFVGRFTYNYDNRYLFETNGAYNGSENFAKGKRFGFFPSLSVGYVISNEEYFKNINPLSFINYLKFRASWGRVGNDNIGGSRFPYLADINLGGIPYTTGRNQNQWRSGPSYNRLQNDNITWEIADKFNAGIDINLFDNIELNIDYFYEDRKDIFDNISNTLPYYFGTGSSNVFGNILEVRKTDVFANVGRVKNQGFDLTLQMNKRIGDDFRINAKGTFTYAHNEIVENNEPLFTAYPNRSRIGRPINAIFGYQAERLFYDQNEINNSPVQNIGGETVQPGDIKYRDITGDGKIDENDQIPLGNPEIPEIVYGLSTTVEYKKWDLSFLLQGTARTSLMMSGFHPFGTGSIRGVLDWVADDRYDPANPDVNAAYPLLSKRNNDNNTVGSSYWLRDASFLKLKNLELGYSLKNFRFFVSGYNLLTVSKFTQWDPEQGGGSGLKYPTQRIVNLGVQLRIN